MFRDTMIRTMPVAMMAMDVLWTERFHMFRAVRKSPPDAMLNATQMPIRATTMPNRRVSISVVASSERHDPPGAAVGVLGLGSATVRTSVINHVSS